MAMVYSMILEDLDMWVKSKPQIGDIAHLVNTYLDKSYLYFYKGPDDNPGLHIIDMEFAQDYYVKEINKLKVEYATVNKRCENCKYFKSISVKDVAMGSWCDNEKHKGMYVPKFVSCSEYEPKEKKSTPFDGVKFYLIDDKSGELAIKYVCEDCGKIMDEPHHWWLSLPLRDITGKQTRAPGYHFRCEECDKKKESKI